MKSTRTPEKLGDAETIGYENLLRFFYSPNTLGATVGRRMQHVLSVWQKLFPESFPPKVRTIGTGWASQLADLSIWDSLQQILLLSLLSPRGNNIPQRLVSWLHSNNWETRAVGQLALAFHLIGQGGAAAEQGWSVFQAEPSPYAKVCACWIPALSLLNSKDQSFDVLRYSENDLSCDRDTCILTLAYSKWRSNDWRVITPFLADFHQYVRETACMGLGIVCEGSCDGDVANILVGHLRDESEIVRTGVYLALGLLFFDHPEEFEVFSHRIDTPRTLAEYRSYHIAKGLAGITEHGTSCATAPPEIRWGKELQQFLAAGQKKSSKSMRRSLLPILYYGTLGSFWWGLWVVGMPGLSDAAEPALDVKCVDPPDLSAVFPSSFNILGQLFQGIRGKFHVMEVTLHSSNEVQTVNFEPTLDGLATYGAFELIGRTCSRQSINRIVVRGYSVLCLDEGRFEIDFVKKSVLIHGNVLPTIEQDVARLFIPNGFSWDNNSRKIDTDG